MITRRIDLKTFLPLLEQSSLEEDHSLHEMWKALLINSIDEAASPIPSSYTFVLSQLSSAEARALSILRTGKLPGHSGDHITNRLSLTDAEIYNLKRLGLLEEDIQYEAIRKYDERIGFKVDYAGSDYRLTPLGESFLASCQA